MSSSRIARKTAQPLLEVLKEMIADGGAAPKHNSRLIFMAWDQASGAAPYTIERYFRDGKLSITLSSSVLCSQLRMQKDVLLSKVNAIVVKDELYIGNAGEGPVKELILK